MQRIVLCGNCHSQIAPGQQFCPNCGARVCPHCNSAVPPRSRFCPNCGFLCGTEQYRGMAQPIPATPSAGIPSAVPRAPSPLPPPSSQDVMRQQFPEVPVTWHQYSCPQCGASIDIASGQCPKCGLLLGKKLIQKMQQQATPAAPAAASGTPTPPSPPAPTRPQSATGPHLGGIYGREPQYNYPGYGATAPPGSGYPPSYGSPGTMPYGGMQQQALHPAPVAASATPATVSPPMPAGSYPYQVVRPAPREWGIPPPTRRFLLKISTTILLAIVGFIGISYAVTQLGTPSTPGTPADTAPPTIASVSASSITETSAVIAWITDEPATSQVMVCDPEGVCSWTDPQETLVTNHSVPLSTLKPNTTYHLTLISEDENGNEATYERDFTTSAQADTTPPMISGVEVSNITESTATINWITDEPATSLVEYGTTDAYGSTTPLDEELTTSHSVTLTELEPDTTYHFRVNSKDASGNEAISETDQTFETPPSIPVGPEVGNRAPDFELERLDGEMVALSDFRGKIVMVNFWATWCGPCVTEMPHIQAVFTTWSGEEELVVLAVNLRDSPAEAQNFVDIREFTFLVLLDSVGGVGSKYNISTIPRTFFIDADGVIQEIQVGAFSSQEEIESILESL